MIHGEKECTVCHGSFTPPRHLSPAQADQTLTCGSNCASIAGNGAKKYRSQAHGSQANIKHCLCSGCQSLRGGDRRVRVAAYIAATGINATIAEGERPGRSPSELSRIAALMRDARRDYGCFDVCNRLPSDVAGEERRSSNPINGMPNGGFGRGC